MKPDTPWRLLVLGCGSAGRRWIELGRELGLSVAAYDVDKGAREQARALGATIVKDVADALWRRRGMAGRGAPHGAIVATWPDSHIELALRCIRADVPVLIEKPLSHTLDGVDDLVRECATRPQLAAGVVCNLRYHPTVTTIKKTLAEEKHRSLVRLRLECGSDLKTWRPGAYTESYGPWLNRGGGVTLDAIHELDLACHLLGQPVAHVGLSTRTGTLTGDAEDVASLVLKHQGGAISNIDLDYLQSSDRRRVTLVSTSGRADFTFDKDPATWRQTYLANLKAWLGAVGGGPCPNPVSEAAQTLRLALAARQESVTRRVA